MAASLACGAEAVVSHGSAAALWEIIPPRHRPRLVEVSLPAGNRRRPGIRVHRVRTLGEDEVTSLEGIPVTTPDRTICDLAGSATRRELERALAEALARRLTTVARITTLLTRHPGRRGSRRLRAIIEGGRPALTRSEAEERLLALVRDARLDEPEVNATVGGFEVDFLWRDQGLVVEVDGFAFHSSPAAFERDRVRDATLAAAGVRVVRVTWRQLAGEREAVLARLAQALALAGRRPKAPPACAPVVRT